jgi:hypothetical protein
MSTMSPLIRAWKCGDSHWNLGHQCDSIPKTQWTSSLQSATLNSGSRLTSNNVGSVISNLSMVGNVGIAVGILFVTAGFRHGAFFYYLFAYWRRNLEFRKCRATNTKWTLLRSPAEQPWQVPVDLPPGLTSEVAHQKCEITCRRSIEPFANRKPTHP